MFTGLVSHSGRLRDIVEIVGEDTIFVIEEQGGLFSGSDEGDSIMCNGVCLTVTELSGDTCSFRVSDETMRCTTLVDWGEGRRVNLERSMRFGDKIGGHLVLGHVDTVGIIVSIESEGGSYNYCFEVRGYEGALVAKKGSVSVDGISLTVNRLEQGLGFIRFWVNVLEFTYNETNLCSLVEGDRVNIEEDMMFRYVNRLLEWKER